LERRNQIMATRKTGKGQDVVVAKQLIAGTAQHLSNTAPAAFLGGSFTADQIASKLQTLVDLRAGVDAARAAAKAKIAAEATQRPPLRAFMSALTAYVKVTFGTAPDVLADFGINPKARVPLTVEEKAAAVAKRAATRAALHTMGSQQKKGIKGTVTGVLVTPISAAPVATAPSGPTAPATSGGSTAASSARNGAAATPRSA
jgi:hypothetical protein